MEASDPVVTERILFLDGKAVLPYEATNLRTSVNFSSKGTVERVALLFKKPSNLATMVTKEALPEVSNYEKIGTLLRVVKHNSEVMVMGGGVNFNNRFMGYGMSRFELVKMKGLDSDEAIIRIFNDEISKDQEEELKKSDKVALLREKAFAFMQAKDKRLESSELSMRNFIYNEDNIVRLCYVFASQLKLSYPDSLDFLKLNKVTERVDFLLHRVQQIKIKEVVFDQNFTFDANSHTDLLRVERMVETLKLPEVAKRAIQTEINKLKKSS